VKELREVRLNPYYFELHISIDNSDSGHAAMAMSAVADYIELTEREEGAEVAHIAWRRVQAGYILAEGLPTTPESPSLKKQLKASFPRNDTEAGLLKIFAAKAFVAHKIHCNSRLKIGRRSLVDWLEPKAFANKGWQRDFLHDLGNCKPWVVKGDSEKSRLVRELSWEGKMFGSFTQTEVEVVKAWIDELGYPVTICQPDSKAYYDFTLQSPKTSSVAGTPELDVLSDYPVLSNLTIPAHTIGDTVSRDLNYDKLRLDCSKLFNFLPLWFTSPTLLETLPSVPVHAANTFGSALIRVLRAQTGFDVEGQGVAGMDEVHRTDDGNSSGIVELGLEICIRADIRVPTDLNEVVGLGNAESAAFCRWMVGFSMQWLAQQDMLIGMSWAFMELHEAVARLDEGQNLLSPTSARVLEDIARRERVGLEICREEISATEQRRADFDTGLATARKAMETFLL